MLGLGLDLKRAENDSEEENIVDTERFFHEVRGQKVEARDGTAADIDPQIEQQ